MRRLYLIIGCLCGLQSCDTLKQSAKVKKDIQSTESITTVTKRPADTLRFEIPKITYKDTTIVKTNYVTRQQARVTFNDQGAVNDVECISAEIEEFRREVRTFMDHSKEKERSKEVDFDSTVILYIVLGIAGIVIVGFYLLLQQMKGQTGAIISLLDR